MYDDGHTANNLHGDSIDNESEEEPYDQDREDEVENSNVPERAHEGEDTIAHISKLKRTKRSNIHTQISELIINATCYFKCKRCAQIYKAPGSTGNITNNHSWNGLKTVQLQRKRENVAVRG